MSLVLHSWIMARIVAVSKVCGDFVRPELELVVDVILRIIKQSNINLISSKRCRPDRRLPAVRVRRHLLTRSGRRRCEAKGSASGYAHPYGSILTEAACMSCLRPRGNYQCKRHNRDWSLCNPPGRHARTRKPAEIRVRMP